MKKGYRSFRGLVPALLAAVLLFTAVISRAGTAAAATAPEWLLDFYENVRQYNPSYSYGYYATTYPYTSYAPYYYNMYVTKIWSGDDGLEESRPESITLHLLQNGNDTGKTLKLSADNGWYGRVIDLPYLDSNNNKYTYALKEEVPDGYEGSLTMGSFWSGDPFGDKSLSLLNILKTGNLSLSKTVVGKNADKTKEFTFTIKLNKKLNGDRAAVLNETTDTSVTFSDGVATVTLTDGDTLVITGLPAGAAYTVTETGSEGYTVSSTNASGAIQKKKTSNVIFVNKKKSSSGGKKPGDGLPHTGDGTDLGFLLAMLAVSGGIGIALARRKHGQD